jgi:hypothetical protein
VGSGSRQKQEHGRHKIYCMTCVSPSCTLYPVHTCLEHTQLEPEDLGSNPASTTFCVCDPASVPYPQFAYLPICRIGIVTAPTS